jgi:hypothetical protein
VRTVAPAGTGSGGGRRADLRPRQLARARRRRRPVATSAPCAAAAGPARPRAETKYPTSPGLVTSSASARRRVRPDHDDLVRAPQHREPRRPDRLARAQRAREQRPHAGGEGVHLDRKRSWPSTSNGSGSPGVGADDGAPQPGVSASEASTVQASGPRRAGDEQVGLEHALGHRLAREPERVVEPLDGHVERVRVRGGRRDRDAQAGARRRADRSARCGCRRGRPRSAARRRRRPASRR